MVAAPPDKAEDFAWHRAIFERVEHVIYRLDFATGRYDYLSETAPRFFGLSADVLRDQGFALLASRMPAADRAATLARINALAAAHPGQQVRTHIDYRLGDANGRQRCYHDSMTIEVNADGTPRLIFGLTVDLTDRPESETILDEKEAQFQATMEAAQAGIFVVQDQVFRYINPYMLKLFGYAADELIGRKGPLDLVSPEQRPFLFEQMQRRAAGEPGNPYELTGVHRDGSRFPVMILGAPAVYGGRPASVGTLLDISRQKAAEQKARELADFDALTGLPNRRLLHDRVAQLLAAAEREQSAVALIFLDLDHFKRINDSLGHSVGDELLCAVAGRLSTIVRKVDTLARLGGDEFIFALPGIHAAAAAEVARRLLEVCMQPFTVAGHELMMTPSLGISIYPQDGRDLETLLRNADTAMYKAKEFGRNGFQFYASEMNTATLEHLMLESSLRRAINQQELVLHYQPLVSLQTGRIVGVEALIRWMHPDLGLIMPDRFIHIAEECGLINPIGDWVLGEACRQAMAWQAEGLPAITMAVNVAPVQFRQAGFIEAVAGALAASGMEAGLLELELTERTVMHDAESTLGTLSALNRMGVELALDDFGTGYSSLAYLKRFPVGKLKIDRSFIHALEIDADDRAIASTIISMARSLRLTVLAEGVETAAQLALLRRMGCDMAQGFHFSQAVPPEEMAQLLRYKPFLQPE